MDINEFVGGEWTNITPHIHPCMSNMGDGTEWQISLSLYTDTEKHKSISGWVGVITGEGVTLNKDHPNYVFKFIKTMLDNPPAYSKSPYAFIIMAKKRKKH